MIRNAFWLPDCGFSPPGDTKHEPPFDFEPELEEQLPPFDFEPELEEQLPPRVEPELEEQLGAAGQETLSPMADRLVTSIEEAWEVVDRMGHIRTELLEPHVLELAAYFEQRMGNLVYEAIEICERGDLETLESLLRLVQGLARGGL